MSQPKQWTNRPRVMTMIARMRAPYWMPAAVASYIISLLVDGHQRQSRNHKSGSPNMSVLESGSQSLIFVDFLCFLCVLAFG